MSDTACVPPNWHIFEKGVDIFVAGSVCKCGKKRTTEKVGTLEDVEPSE